MEQWEQTHEDSLYMSQNSQFRLGFETVVCHVCIGWWASF